MELYVSWVLLITYKVIDLYINNNYNSSILSQSQVFLAYMHIFLQICSKNINMIRVAWYSFFILDNLLYRHLDYVYSSCMWVK